MIQHDPISQAISDTTTAMLDARHYLGPISAAIDAEPFVAPETAKNDRGVVGQNGGKDGPQKGEGAPPAAGKKPKSRWARTTGEECPVHCLGHNDGVFYYASPSGQVRALAARSHGRLDLQALFENRVDWLYGNFAKTAIKRDEGEEIEIVVGWKPEKLAEYLMAECSLQPIFNPATMLRGPGVWRLEDNRLIVHCGDVLLVPDDMACGGGEKIANGYTEIPAGCRLEGLVYPAAPAESRPSLDTPATDQEAKAILSLLKRWNWRDANYAPLLWLGFAASSMVSGAHKWRPHIWVSGDAGTGKTQLSDVFKNLCGKTAVLSVSAPTEAGLRQALQGSSRPVMVDEVEPSPFNNRAQGIQELARLASSDGQGAVVRGSSGGQAQAFPIRGSFYCTSILHPEAAPQDRSRITFLNLEPLKDFKAAMQPEELAQARKLVAKLGPKLRARMVLGYDRMQHNFEVFYSALAACDYTRRQIDQLATLLACAYTLLEEEPLSAVGITDLIDELGFTEAEDEMSDADECLQHLLTSSPDLWRGGTRKTMVEIFAAASEAGGTDERQALRSLGIALEPNNEKFTLVLLANQHQGLQALFKDTRWRGGVHAQSLRRLAGAHAYRKTVSLGGKKTKATAVPAEHFLALAGGEVD